MTCERYIYNIDAKWILLLHITQYWSWEEMNIYVEAATWACIWTLYIPPVEMQQAHIIINPIASQCVVMKTCGKMNAIVKFNIHASWIYCICIAIIHVHQYTSMCFMTCPVPSTAMHVYNIIIMLMWSSCVMRIEAKSVNYMLSSCILPQTWMQLSFLNWQLSTYLTDHFLLKFAICCVPTWMLKLFHGGSSRCTFSNCIYMSIYF